MCTRRGPVTSPGKGKRMKNLPEGTLRTSFCIDGCKIKLIYLDGHYCIESHFYRFLKTTDLKLAELAFETVCMVNGHKYDEVKATIKHVRTEDKRLPPMFSRCRGKLWDTEASRFNAVVDGAIKRLEGLRPVCHKSYTEWVKA
jgi:hypothetical protein